MELKIKELEEEVQTAYIEWLMHPNPKAKQALNDVKDQLTHWRQLLRSKHCEWIYNQESKGIPIHKTTLPNSPKHPNSYLLYNDSGILIFRRNHSDLYSSYEFWLEHMSVKEPIEELGKEYFSAKELGVIPELIEELYTLQTAIIKTGDVNPADLERMCMLQEEVQQAFSKIEDKIPLCYRYP